MLNTAVVLKPIVDDQIPHRSNTIELRAYFNDNKPGVFFVIPFEEQNHDRLCA